MRVLMLSDVYFPRVNGVSTSIDTFRRELERSGHEITLVAPAYDGAAESTEEVLRVPSRYLFFDPEDRLMSVRALRRMHDEMRERAPEIVHVQTPFVAHRAGLAIARRFDVPVVESYHTFFEEYFHFYAHVLPRSLTRAVARSVSRRQCNAVDGLVVPSHAMLRVLRGYGVRTVAEVIPTGVDVESFRSRDGEGFRRRHGIDADRPLVAYIGRVAFEKNIEFLLHVIDRVRNSMPEVLLVIAGEGPAERELQRLVARLEVGHNVRFVGYLDRSTGLANCYCAADALLFASRTETQGLVLLEAMALGVPVVSTAVMGTVEVLRGAKGALVVREDVTEFAGEVLRILGDERLRRRLGAEAEVHAREWSAAALAGRLSEFYRTVSGAESLPGRALEGRT